MTKRNVSGRAAVYFLLSTIAHPLGADAQSPSVGAAVTGVYRNLFVEAGHSPREVSAKIEAAFQQLFHGDSATQTVYYRAGEIANGPLAYVTDINNHDVRTARDRARGDECRGEPRRDR